MFNSQYKTYKTNTIEDRDFLDDDIKGRLEWGYALDQTKIKTYTLSSEIKKLEIPTDDQNPLVKFVFILTELEFDNSQFPDLRQRIIGFGNQCFDSVSNKILIFKSTNHDCLQLHWPNVFVYNSDRIRLLNFFSKYTCISTKYVSSSSLCIPGFLIRNDEGYNGRLVLDSIYENGVLIKKNLKKRISIHDIIPFVDDSSENQINTPFKLEEEESTTASSNQFTFTQPSKKQKLDGEDPEEREESREISKEVPKYWVNAGKSKLNPIPLLPKWVLDGIVEQCPEKGPLISQRKTESKNIWIVESKSKKKDFPCCLGRLHKTNKHSYLRVKFTVDNRVYTKCDDPECKIYGFVYLGIGMIQSDGTMKLIHRFEVDDEINRQNTQNVPPVVIHPTSTTIKEVFPSSTPALISVSVNHKPSDHQCKSQDENERISYSELDKCVEEIESDPKTDLEFDPQHIDDDLRKPFRISILRMLVKKKKVDYSLQYINRYVCFCRKGTGCFYSRCGKGLIWDPTNIQGLINLFRGVTIKINGKDRLLFDAWLDNSFKRMCDDVIWSPKPNTDPSVLNLYPGNKCLPSNFSSADLEVITDPFFQHIFVIWCKRNWELFYYIIKYFARILQRPWSKTGVALILTSLPGRGKNIIFDVLEKIMGTTCASVNPLEDVFGNYNSHIAHTLLLVFDETEYTQSKEHANRIKYLVTSKNIHIKEKYKNASWTKSYTNCVFLSNDRIAGHIELNDRRYVCVDLDDTVVLTDEYFTKIRKVNRAAVLQKLLSIDISDFSVRNHRPTTKSYVNHKMAALNSTQKWIFHSISNPSQSPQCDWIGKSVQKQHLDQSFMTWSGESKIPYGFLLELGRFGIMKESRQSSKNDSEHFIKVPAVDELRLSFCNQLGYHTVEPLWPSDPVVVVLND